MPTLIEPVQQLISLACAGLGLGFIALVIGVSFLHLLDRIRDGASDL